MNDTLFRETVEIERQRDAFTRLDRINGVEKDFAVLKTLFDAAIKSILEKLADAVSDDDLKQLKREMEAEVNKQIGHVCDHFDSKTEQQSKDILVRVEGMFQAQHAQIAEANRRTRLEIIRYGVGFAMTVLSALTVIWLTR